MRVCFEREKEDQTRNITRNRGMAKKEKEKETNTEQKGKKKNRKREGVVDEEERDRLPPSLDRNQGLGERKADVGVIPAAPG